MPVKCFKNNDNNNVLQFLLRRKTIFRFITEILQRLKTKSKGPICKNIYGHTYKTHWLKTLSQKAGLTNLNILRKKSLGPPCKNNLCC